jgi:hypothetical protein
VYVVDVHVVKIRERHAENAQREREEEKRESTNDISTHPFNCTLLSIT